MRVALVGIDVASEKMRQFGDPEVRRTAGFPAVGVDARPSFPSVGTSVSLLLIACTIDTAPFARTMQHSIP